MAIPDLDRLARAAAAEVCIPTRRVELIGTLQHRGHSVPESIAIVAYALAAGLLVERSSILAPSSPTAVSPGGRGWILVIEDDEACAASFKETLEAEGHASVRVARNGKEALRILARAEKPRLVLLDLMMPVMDGWQLLAILQEDEDLRSVPVVIVSAAKNLPAGARGLAKPVQLAALLSAVDHAFSSPCPA
jgi:two-component system, chemotaxis family, chemotaxis protein CheY